ncbi:hypothetical protein [Chondromyces crocatus]|uniref:Uncharacterized protein n=1 Tax=Chondromyces crocatus TaxID=52 RepID=A0A0K1EHM6_CHOCO|nr:hypothetical protein [Chondromyces crocatus]AKT40078.1 uncharacterized protein CMC5_042310 [Chondromyces crocatus]
MTAVKPPSPSRITSSLAAWWQRLRALEGLLLPPFLLVAALMACKTGRIDIYTCPDPCKECADPCSCPEGTCVPPAPLGWEGPVLLWYGTPADEPECPERAPAPVYEGYRGLKTIPECARCECAPPSCELPQQVSASATDGMCGVPLVTRDFPEDWDGSCLAIDPLMAPESLRVGATRMGACEPVTISVQKASFGWETKAKGCKALRVTGKCELPHEECAPRLETVRDGFELCVFQGGDGRPESPKPGWGPSCPEGYPQARVFYGGVADDSSCLPCSCGAPEGGECDAALTVYEGADCSGDSQMLPSSITNGSCVPYPHQSTLLSVDAVLETSNPGSCKPSGGNLVNGGTLLEPATFCCR